MAEAVAEARQPGGLVQDVGHAVAALGDVQLAVGEVPRGHLVGQEQLLGDPQVGLVAVPVAGVLVPAGRLDGPLGVGQQVLRVAPFRAPLGEADRGVDELAGEAGRELRVVRRGAGELGEGSLQRDAAAVVVEPPRDGPEGLAVDVRVDAERERAADALDRDPVACRAL